jgi:hypothetical protein
MSLDDLDIQWEINFFRKEQVWYVAMTIAHWPQIGHFTEPTRGTSGFHSDTHPTHVTHVKRWSSFIIKERQVIVCSLYRHCLLHIMSMKRKKDTCIVIWWRNRYPKKHSRPASSRQWDWGNPFRFLFIYILFLFSGRSNFGSIRLTLGSSRLVYNSQARASECHVTARLALNRPEHDQLRQSTPHARVLSASILRIT